ncbi:MAG: 3-dehydroquinate synthase [Eubacteriales bacterium]|nr:3-dehydroquinate synthase [Eubacteriales bacterium]MDY3332478.1 3-dehydroquinate synthase [Gallibacter sp.]
MLSKKLKSKVNLVEKYQVYFCEQFDDFSKNMALVELLTPYKKIHIITDRNVADYYLENLRNVLNDIGISVSVSILVPGERIKNIENYTVLVEDLMKNSISRRDVIIALGGGAVGDLAGFVAGTYMRGIDFINVPTTLLAMVDSSIGGKSGLNVKNIKNIVGLIKNPKANIIIPDLMNTVREDDFTDTLSELIKIAIIRDAKLFEKLEDIISFDIDEKNTRETFFREDIKLLLMRCVENKLAIVDEDIYDKGVRRVLNLGHTVGHAIESYMNYDISHGLAVAKGMYAIADISEQMEFCDKKTSNRIKSLLTLLYGKHISDKEATSQQLIEYIRHDKKSDSDEIDVVLIKKIGQCEIVKMDISEFGNLL